MVKYNDSDCVSFININHWSSMVAQTEIMITTVITTHTAPQYHRKNVTILFLGICIKNSTLNTFSINAQDSLSTKNTVIIFYYSFNILNEYYNVLII